MEKTKNNMKQNYSQKTMLHLYKKIEYYKDLIVLTEAEMREKLQQKIKNREDKDRILTNMLKLRTLSEDAFVNEMSFEKVKKLDKKYVLKKRALKQTWLRKKKDIQSSQYQEAIKELDDKHQQDIEAFNQRYVSQYRHLDQWSLEYFDQQHEKIQAEQKELFKKWEDDVNTRIQKKKEALSNKCKTLETLYQKKKEVQHDQIQQLDTNTILEVKNLTMKFGGLTAVDNLSFSIKEGEIFGLIGPNGAGKTTVFNCITQFYKPANGEILFRDLSESVLSLNQYKVHQVIGHGIARTFQNIELIWELSVLDNLLIGAHSMYQSGFFSHLFHSIKFKREERVLKMKAEKILHDLGIHHYMHFYPIGLPYGVLKTIEFARTLMTNPKLIILDEPAAGLNDSETEFLAKTIKKIQKEYGATIFLVEHDMNLVMSICDTVCAISFGKKLAIGKPEEIQRNALVQEAYLGGE